MPNRRNQQSYPVSTALILILFGIGAGSYFLRRSIPLPAANNLISEPAPYLASGARQPIEWFALDRDAFRRAAQSDRLVMLVIGTPASRAARIADASAFTDLELSEELRQSFVTIRVDMFDMPAWQNAYLPLSRGLIGLDPAFQIWILDPKASMFKWYLRQSPAQRADAFTLLRLVRDARREISLLQQGSPELLAAGEAQRLDQDAIAKAVPQAFDYDAHRTWLTQHVHPEFGGIVRDELLGIRNPEASVFQQPKPFAWRYLMQMGDAAIAAKSMDPMLLSPLVDWISGGFFRQANRLDWSDVEPDQHARVTADVMATLALRWSLDRDELSKLLAERAFDSLTTSFVADRGIAAYIAGKESYFGRSPRATLTPRAMRESFSPEEREWLRRNLGLRVESNPQMFPKLAGREVLSENRTELLTMLIKMRELLITTEIERGRTDYMDINGFVCARLIETALRLGDARRLEIGRSQFPQLRRFRVGPDDVIHSLRKDRGSTANLPDYLAFADAAIQDSMSSGDLTAAKEGAEVLSRAIFVFESEVPGVFYDGKLDGESPWPSDVLSPDFCDDMGESSTAALLRLCGAYARLCASVPGVSQGGEETFRRVGQSIASRCASLMPSMRMEASAIACASRSLDVEEWAVCIGPNAKHQALKLRSTEPFLPVIPLINHPTKEPGIYRVTLNGEWKRSD